MKSYKKYTFLGMYIELLDYNKFSIVMNSYIQESINLFDEEFFTKLSSPENKNLHELNTEPPKLPKNQEGDFYSIFANILCITKQ